MRVSVVATCRAGAGAGAGAGIRQSEKNGRMENRQKIAKNDGMTWNAIMEKADRSTGAVGKKQRDTKSQRERNANVTMTHR